MVWCQYEQEKVFYCTVTASCYNLYPCFVKERAYEEIQDRPHATESSTAIRGIYVTAGFPQNPPTENPVGGA